MGQVESSLKSISLVSGLSLARLLVQFVLQVLLAKYFGAQADMDAFVAVLAFPTVVSLVLTGSVPYAFLPVFVSRRERAGERAAWTLVGNALALVGLLCLTVAGVAGWQAARVVGVLLPGFEGRRFELAVSLFRILVWLVVTNGLLAVVQAVNHGSRRFGTPEAATLVGSALTVVFILWRHDADGIFSVAWGVLLGSAVGVVLQSGVLLRHGTLMSLRWDSGTGRWLRLAAPLVLGAAYYKLDPLVDRYLASSLPEGNLSHLGYAWRILNALLVLGTSGLSVVAFPALAKHASLHDSEGLRAEMAHAFRFLCYVLVPVTFGLAAFSRPLVRDLFQRGVFRPEDTAAVAGLLVIYLGTLWGAGVGEVASKVFYAVGNTTLPMLVGACGFTLGAVLKVACTPRWGVPAIAAATSFYYLANSLTLLGLVLRRWGWRTLNGLGRSVWQYALGTAVGLLVAWAVVSLGGRLSTFYAAPTAAAAYWLTTLALGDEFSVKLRDFLVGQVRQLAAFRRTGQ